MQVQSAGILMYKFENGEAKIFLCKPFLNGVRATKEKIWGIPKGRINENEEVFEAAKREFFEETGLEVKNIPMFHLGSITYNIYPHNTKKLHCWVMENNPPSDYGWKSNLFENRINDKLVMTPEIVDWKWFTIKEAEQYILKSQEQLLLKFKSYLKFLKQQNLLSYGEETSTQGTTKSSSE